MVGKLYGALGNFLSKSSAVRLVRGSSGVAGAGEGDGEGEKSLSLEQSKSLSSSAIGFCCTAGRLIPLDPEEYALELAVAMESTALRGRCIAISVPIRSAASSEL